MRKNLALALSSGLLLAASWPTNGIAVLIFVAFVPLLVLEHNCRTNGVKRHKTQVFFLSYISFVIWNAFTTGWLIYSSVFGGLFAVLVNSLLMATLFLLYHIVARRLPQKQSLFFLAALWMSFEKLHLGWAFSWPWLNLGNVFSETIHWVQWYEFTGIFGGSLWIWIVNAGIFSAVIGYTKVRAKRKLVLQVSMQIVWIALPIIVSLFLFENYEASNTRTEVVLLQPNVDPYTEKYNQKNAKTAASLVELARPFLTQKTSFVMAPETVLSTITPIDHFQKTEGYALLNALVDDYPNLSILAGADLYRLYPQKEKPSKTANLTKRGDWVDYYNAAVFINKSTPLETYIKSKLVVGVETFPFKNILEPLLGNVMLDLGGTISARGLQDEREVFVAENGDFRVAPIICYESIYGEYVTEYVRNGANFLTIITNDGWWKTSQGHKQHLSYARLRAVETRRSVARSANTGISAFITPQGIITKTLAYGEKGALKGRVEIKEKTTLYVKYGDFIARIALFIAALLFLNALAKRKISN